MSRSGFTLLELMIAVAIIGILASIATVKYANLYRKAEEGGLQGNLGSIRSALSIYYADMDGLYPQSLSVLTSSARYLKEIPPAKVPGYHDASVLVTLASSADDGGGWVYNPDATHLRYGAALVNCIQTDSKGSVWSSY
jgi:prepilin-type N-terminal cleavage/methylation domain-containing protein